VTSVTESDGQVISVLENC